MASPGRVVISNPQNVTKDCFATSAKIDLTVRANGEEKVQVMDSLGNFNVAGIEAPTAAATITTGTPTSVFPNTVNEYWAYQYVYVAKIAYPLVENAVTGGGSPAPRSNPSPVSAIQNTVAANAASAGVRVLSLPASTRGDISHIWIYRTGFFTSTDEASTNAQAGNLTWIGEIANPTSGASSVNFTDSNTVVFGANDQIENDNFVSFIFKNAIYVDPYFWGFGNDMRQLAVSITSAGVVTATSELWYNGRDGQSATFAGVTTGGYDNKGSYYFKTTSSTTAQVYGDLALTLPIGLPVSGTTIIYLRGFSTTLYRSKPRNPFSWGDSTQVGDLLIPAPYAFSVGGGNGTAISVIPNQNLLKLDTEGPNRCYTLNLKNAGTPNFESSLRVIADNYSVSNQFAQFSATIQTGQNVLWGIDTKSFAIVQCDGTEQRPISDMVYQTMRNMSLESADRNFFHGIYIPRAECNCIFIRQLGAYNDDLNVMIYQHAPTGFWGRIEIFDILCSAQVFDNFEGQQKVIVGTSSGFLGELFAEKIYQNWFTPQFDIDGNFVDGVFIPLPDPDAPPTSNNRILTPFKFQQANFFSVLAMEGVVGNWLTIVQKIAPALTSSSVYYCRISGFTDTNFNVVLFDRVIKDGVQSTFPGAFSDDLTICYLGLIEFEAARLFTVQTPFELKKLEQIYSSWRNLPALAITSNDWYIQPRVLLNPNLIPEGSSLEASATAYARTMGVAELPLVPASNSLFNSQFVFTDSVFALQSGLDIDIAQSFLLSFRERGIEGVQLLNYEIRLNKVQ